VKKEKSSEHIVGRIYKGCGIFLKKFKYFRVDVDGNSLRHEVLIVLKVL